jgi:hypothetical protein
MAYNDLANNQTVSYNNLQSGVNQGAFTAKTTIPSSNKQVTKAEANIYVNINTSLSSYAAKASNRLITKQDLSGVTLTYYTWYISQPQTSSCSGFGYYPITVYSNNPSFLSGAIFYTNTGLTDRFNGLDSWYMDSDFESGCTIQIGTLGQTIQQGCC